MKLLKQFGELDSGAKFALVIICFTLSSGLCEIVKIITGGIVNAIYR